MDRTREHPELATCLHGADHADAKTMEGNVSLRHFNLIRPFHHLVVSRMMKAGIRP